MQTEWGKRESRTRKAEAHGPLQGLPCPGSWHGCSWLLPTLSLQELFKAFARHLSHSLTQNLCPGRSVKEEAQDVIKQLFRGRARCESEADWHGLCGLQR